MREGVAGGGGGLIRTLAAMTGARKMAVRLLADVGVLGIIARLAFPHVVVAITRATEGGTQMPEVDVTTHAASQLITFQAVTNQIRAILGGRGLRGRRGLGWTSAISTMPSTQNVTQGRDAHVVNVSARGSIQQIVLADFTAA